MGSDGINILEVSGVALLLMYLEGGVLVLKGTRGIRGYSRGIFDADMLVLICICQSLFTPYQPLTASYDAAISRILMF